MERHRSEMIKTTLETHQQWTITDITTTIIDDTNTATLAAGQFEVPSRNDCSRSGPFHLCPCLDRHRDRDLVHRRRRKLLIEAAHVHGTHPGLILSSLSASGFRSSSPKRRKHQKDKRQHSHTSTHHRKKDRKRRSRSSSSEDRYVLHESSLAIGLLFSSRRQNNKHPLSTKDTNNHAHQRSHHHHSSKSTNGVSSSSSLSQKTLNSK